MGSEKTLRRSLFRALRCEFVEGLLRGGPLRGGLQWARSPHWDLYGEGPLRELNWNFRFCTVDQKRPIEKRVGPFLTLCPLRGVLTGRSLTARALTGKVSLGPLRGRALTGIGLEFPLVCHRPRKGRFQSGLGRFWTLGPARGHPYGKVPYWEASCRQGPGPCFLIPSP